MPFCGLYGYGGYSKIYDDERGFFYAKNKKYLYLYLASYDLDFSEDFPELKLLKFPNSFEDYYRNVKSDLGLSNNVNLKQLEFFEDNTGGFKTHKNQKRLNHWCNYENKVC